MNDINKSWKKFLDPEVLKNNLIGASLYIAAFELCKTRIIKMPQSFFSTLTDTDGSPSISEDYKKNILSRSKSPLYASLDWFREMNAISQDDIDQFDKIRMHRNEIAHELPLFLSDGTRNIDFLLFKYLFELINKIEKWWVINVEVPINPDFDGEEINEGDVQTGTMLTLQIMLDVAIGNKPDEKYYPKLFESISH